MGDISLAESIGWDDLIASPYEILSPEQGEFIAETRLSATDEELIHTFKMSVAKVRVLRAHSRMTSEIQSRVPWRFPAANESPQQTIESASINGLHIMRLMMLDETVPSRIQLKIAIWFLEKAEGRPCRKIVTKSPTMIEFMDLLSAINSVQMAKLRNCAELQATERD